MPPETNEPQDVEIEEVEDAEDNAPEPTDDINELKDRLKKFEEKSITQRERTRAMRAEIDKLKKATTPKTDVPKTNELDETQLDYLDLKGISDEDEIDVIQKVMHKTGQTVRQALKDEYVQEKLTKLRAEKEVKGATPSSTKRSGGSIDGLAVALAKYKQSGFTDLPSDFALRTAVINAVTEESNPNKPSWH